MSETETPQPERPINGGDAKQIPSDAGPVLSTSHIRRVHGIAKRNQLTHR